ncbi:hypothetical protein [Jongsikchunia kroppenstedtii]|uniref:hypothetical protein n=1 Tax=Jongsikchunia kroppenstedtii TaxID=1121721 RepID=UPI0003666318|nr:hypothetical protein [Jongsikchunia kroppenstedtii]
MAIGMSRGLLALGAVAAVALTAGCSDSDDRNSSFAPQSQQETVSVDTQYLTENLPIVAGNVVTTVNNAREQGWQNTPDGDVYDVGQYYDAMTPECKTKITRSVFRRDFINRVVPMIDDAKPERITVSIQGTEATARVEQVSGRTLVMLFDVDGSSENHECNSDGTIAITTGAGAS